MAIIAFIVVFFMMIFFFMIFIIIIIIIIILQCPRKPPSNYPCPIYPERKIYNDCKHYGTRYCSYD